MRDLSEKTVKSVPVKKSKKEPAKKNFRGFKAEGKRKLLADEVGK